MDWTVLVFHIIVYCFNRRIVNNCDINYIFITVLSQFTQKNPLIGGLVLKDIVSGRVYKGA